MAQNINPQEKMTFKDIVYLAIFLIILISVVIYFWEYIIEWLYDCAMGVIRLVAWVMSILFSIGIYYSLYKTVKSFYYRNVKEGLLYLLFITCLVILLVGIDATGLLDEYKE